MTFVWSRKYEWIWGVRAFSFKNTCTSPPECHAHVGLVSVSGVETRDLELFPKCNASPWGIGMPRSYTKPRLPLVHAANISVKDVWVWKWTLNLFNVGQNNEILFNFSCLLGTKLLTIFLHRVCFPTQFSFSPALASNICCSRCPAVWPSSGRQKLVWRSLQLWQQPDWLLSRHYQEDLTLEGSKKVMVMWVILAVPFGVCF